MTARTEGLLYGTPANTRPPHDAGVHPASRLTPAPSETRQAAWRVAALPLPREAGAPPVASSSLCWAEVARREDRVVTGSAQRFDPWSKASTHSLGHGSAILRRGKRGRVFRGTTSTTSCSTGRLFVRSCRLRDGEPRCRLRRGPRGSSALRCWPPSRGDRQLSDARPVGARGGRL